MLFILTRAHLFIITDLPWPTFHSLFNLFDFTFQCYLTVVYKTRTYKYKKLFYHKLFFIWYNIRAWLSNHILLSFDLALPATSNYIPWLLFQAIFSLIRLRNSWILKRQPHEMVKHTQTIRRQNICRLSQVLPQFLFTTSESELDYYNQNLKYKLPNNYRRRIFQENPWIASNCWQVPSRPSVTKFRQLY